MEYVATQRDPPHKIELKVYPGAAHAFDVVGGPMRIIVDDDIERAADLLRPSLALYIGGMGARSKNFYNDLVKRMGYEEAAVRIQDLFLDGKRNEAAAAVPDALIDETCLIGPPARIKDRLQAWQTLARDHRVGTLLLADVTIDALRVVAEAAL